MRDATLPWQVRIGHLSLKKRAKLTTLLPRILSWGPGRFLEIGPGKGVLAWHLKADRGCDRRPAVTTGRPKKPLCLALKSE